MIEVKVDNAAVMAAMQKLAHSAANLRPPLLALGEELTKSTKKRFETSTAPDGTKWAPNKPSTLKRKKGNKPLIGKTGTLAQQISYAVGLDSLMVGSTSPMKYAAMQQFGGKKSRFPNLWGDIPARPFLGISDADEKMIVNTVDEYLRRAVGG
jgi:phage virion morphogenesis protein